MDLPSGGDGLTRHEDRKIDDDDDDGDNMISEFPTAGSVRSTCLVERDAV
jgi:hypothetical protein